MARKTRNYEFRIADGEVTERVHFGAFEIVKTKRGIMFKTYTGFHVWTTPYAVGLDGKAQPKSLYAWLDNLIEAKKAYKGHESEPFGGGGHTKGEILESMVVLTQANLVYPLTAFIDEERATKFALEYMEWLKKQQEKLAEAMSAPVEDENLKEEFEQGEKVKILGEALDVITEEGVSHG